MDRIKHYSLYFIVGAIVYWVPDILIQWIRPPHKIWIILLTFLVPFIVGAVWFQLRKKEKYKKYRIGFPLFMLLGIWVIAPLAIAVGMIPAGGKFFEPGQIENMLSIMVYFPMATISMSTYSGSLGGVGLVTLGLIVASVVSGIRNYASNK
ncbi:MAG: hypothetical protein AB2689_26000 [Candidatus Thiodiazotropha taylori]